MELMNSFGISAVINRLYMHIRATSRTDSDDFSTLCLSLARGIDLAVANNEIPHRASDLPVLVKQVYQRKIEYSFQPVIMALMISIKNACKSGWFLAKDADELLKLASEIGSIFWSEENIHIEPSNALPVISKIIARFYPRMVIGQVLAFLEFKPGYGTYAADFDIQERAMNTDEKIYLVVAQTDNTETSSCIITPPLVSFLLNGEGVPNRVNVSMDTGPQMPTNVTSMLKYGTNLLQAIGEFNGTYIVAIVFMRVNSSSETPILQDYVRSLLTSQNSDPDVVERSSRMSLNCPISLKRIKTPVKGHRCKHHQCFDYANFIEINSRKPSWCCPLCGQSVCFTDIRIDKFVVKILKEVEDGVHDVIISADASWNIGTVGSESSKTVDIVIDLSMGGMDDNTNTCEMEERKPLFDIHQGLLSVTNMNETSEVDHNYQIAPNATSQIEDDTWSGILSSPSFGVANNNSDPLPDPFTVSSVPTTVSSDQTMVANSQPLNSQIGNFFVLNGGRRSSVINNMTIPAVSQAAVPIQVNPSQTVSSSHPWSSVNPNSLMPIVAPPVPLIQLLRPQTIPNSRPQSIPNSRPQSSTSMNSFMSTPVTYRTTVSTEPTAGGLNTGGSEPSGTERQQQFVPARVTLAAAPNTASFSAEHYLRSQYPSMVRSLSNQHPQNRTAPVMKVRQSTASPQIMVGESSNLSYLQQAPHMRVRQSTRPPLTHIQQGIQSTLSQLPNQHPQNTSASSVQALKRVRVPPVRPVQLQPLKAGSSLPTVPGNNSRPPLLNQQRGTYLRGSVQKVSRIEDLVGSIRKQNLQPQKRMRGDMSRLPLSGSLSQSIFQPTQPSPQFRQAAQQPSGQRQSQMPHQSMNACRTAPQQQQSGPTMTGDTVARPGNVSSGTNPKN